MTKLKTQIIEKLPKVEPFYTQVINAVDKMEHGDKGSNPPLEIMHGYYSTLACCGLLDDRSWLLKNEGKVLLAFHRDFLKIQDEFSLLEKGVTKEIQWTGKQAINAMTRYLQVKETFRKKHIYLFNNAVNRIDTKSQETIRKMVNSGQVNRVDLQLHSIVAIPWFTDNMEIWTSTGLTSGQLQKIAPYAKINECGILYASRIHRDDKPEGHDYFSYAARLVTEGKTKTIEESLLLTAQHEGAHGPVDEITQKLLKTTDATCIYEGIAGSLGDDRRDLVKTNTPYTVLIENPCVFAKPEDMQERIYIFGAKFFSAVRNTLKDKNHTDNDGAWITIFSILLKLSLKLSTDEDFLAKDENSKVSYFLQKVLRKCGLSKDELQTHYQTLNT